MVNKLQVFWLHSKGAASALHERARPISFHHHCPLLCGTWVREGFLGLPDRTIQWSGRCQQPAARSRNDCTVQRRSTASSAPCQRTPGKFHPPWTSTWGAPPSLLVLPAWMPVNLASQLIRLPSQSMSRCALPHASFPSCMLGTQSDIMCGICMKLGSRRVSCKAHACICRHIPFRT